MLTLVPLVLLLVIATGSCKKNSSNSDSDYTVPPATFSFESNGKPYEFNGDLTNVNPKGSKIEQIDIWVFTHYEKVYYFTGSNGLAPNDPNYFTFSIPVGIDSIMRVGTYSGNLYNATGILGSNQYGNGTGGGNNFRFNFTQVTNDLNFGNGDIYALLSPVDTSLHLDPLTIYGEFKHVKIIR